MAEEKKSSGDEANETSEEKLKKKIRRFENLVSRLESETDELKEAMGDEYREAKRYVRLHPEESMLAAMAGGLFLGFILGRLSK